MRVCVCVCVCVCVTCVMCARACACVRDRVCAQDNYTFAQPGIQRTVFKLREIMHKAPPLPRAVPRASTP